MHEIAVRKGNEKELVFQIPLSEVYKFNDPEKTKSLVETHKEGLPAHSEMRPAKRFIVSSVGIFFLMIGLMGLFSKNVSFLTIVLLIAGFSIIWFFIAKPESEKRKARTGARQEIKVSLSFNENNIIVRSRHHELKRLWPELIEYKKTKKGIHLHFIDGTVNWLPTEVFYGTDEMNELVGLLQKKITNNQPSITN